MVDNFELPILHFNTAEEKTTYLSSKSAKKKTMTFETIATVRETKDKLVFCQRITRCLTRGPSGTVTNSR